jgi:hypothetical protein
MKNIRLILAAVTLTFLTGCATTTPTPQQFAEADYGDYPTNYKTLIGNYYRQYLKDPDSAQFQFESEPYKDYTYRTPNGKLVFGYSVDFSLNAKNSYGGYVGFQPKRALIHNSQIHDVTVVRAMEMYRRSQ